ncbi:MAG: adenylosuccinate lyase [Acidimicrobiales bacterium]
MIGRYSTPEMAALWSDEARLSRWLEVEVLAVEAWAELGVVPAADAAALRERAPVVDDGFAEAVARREAVTDHDVAAFVDVVQEAVGPPAGAWLHYGLTSSDVVDTALSATLVAASDLLIVAAGDLIAVLGRRAQDLAGVAMAGRTHGIHAEPVSFGAKLALWCAQVDRDRHRLRGARRGVAVGKLSGAVGTYATVDPAVEAHVCAALGLAPVPATQVVARDRHAEYLWACACVGATVEMIATELRHLQRTEVAEVSEPFAEGQKGSSAMPHKRNPWRSEQLCGLARLLRSYVVPGLEDVALWHERDISHSSVERVVLPDASLLAYYLLRRVTGIVEHMVVNAPRMLENLESSHGVVFSQPVLLALVARGLSRDAAYRLVQRDARAAWETRKPLRSVLEADPEVALSDAELDDAFSLERALRHAHLTIDALEGIEGAPVPKAPVPKAPVPKGGS